MSDRANGKPNITFTGDADKNHTPVSVLHECFGEKAQKTNGDD